LRLPVGIKARIDNRINVIPYFYPYLFITSSRVIRDEIPAIDLNEINETADTSYDLTKICYQEELCFGVELI
jgi:hypothetical protein